MVSRCSIVVVERISSVVFSIGCRGFIVRPIATAGLLSLKT